MGVDHATGTIQATALTYTRRRSQVVRRYSLDANGVAILLEDSRLQRPADRRHATVQDANVGAVLADALDENDNRRVES